MFCIVFYVIKKICRAANKHDTSDFLFIFTLPATLNVLFNSFSKLVCSLCSCMKKNHVLETINILRVTKVQAQSHVQLDSSFSQASKFSNFTEIFQFFSLFTDVSPELSTTILKEIYTLYLKLSAISISQLSFSDNPNPPTQCYAFKNRRNDHHFPAR